MTRPLVFIDIETDGLNPGRHAWEVAWIKRDVDGTETDRSMFLAIDVTHSDVQSLNIGGFYDRHPMGRKMSGKEPRPTEQVPVFNAHDAAREIARATHGATLVGANPHFDATVLERLLRSQGYLPAWHYRLRCVESLTAGWLGVDIGGLADCVERLGITPGPAHRALGDATTAMRIWDFVMESDEEDDDGVSVGPITMPTRGVLDHPVVVA